MDWKGRALALVSNTYIVQFHEGTGTSGDLAYELRERGAIIRYVYPHAILGFSAVIEDEALLDELRSDERIKTIEPDQEHHIEFLSLPPITEQTLVNMGPGWNADLGEQGVAHFGKPWQLDRISKTDPVLDDTYRYRYTGAGVRIYYADTGVSDHNDFAGRLEGIWTDVAWAPDTDANNDLGHHGTVGAGMAAGAITGVAKEATIVSCRLGLGAVSEMIEMCNTILSDYNSQPEGTRACFNASYAGFLDEGTTLFDAYAALWDAGIVLVCAGGNSVETGPGTNLPQKLSEVGKIIVVGASSGLCGPHGTDTHYPNRRPYIPFIVNSQGKVDGIDPYSARGAWVDIYAPSNGCTVSANYNNPSIGHPLYGIAQPYPDALGEYDRSSLGTSFASPMVCGVVALLLEEFPNATPTEIKTILLDRSMPTLVDADEIDNNRMLTNCQNLWEENSRTTVEVDATNTYTDTSTVRGNWYRYRIRRRTSGLIKPDWSENW